jgi:hypothetical protein
VRRVVDAAVDVATLFEDCDPHPASEGLCDVCKLKSALREIGEWP